MTSTNDKLRAIFLSALMVVSIFGAAVAFTGSAAAVNTDADEDYDDRDAVLQSSTTFWQGQELYLGNDTDGNNYIVSSEKLAIKPVNSDQDGTDTLVKQFYLNEHGGFLLDTSGLDTGEYVITQAGDAIEFGNNGEANGTHDENSEAVTNASFSITTQSLSTDFVDSDDDVVESTNNVEEGEDTHIEFDTNRAGFNVTVETDAYDYDDDELVDIFGEELDWDRDDEDDEFFVTDVSDEKYEVNFSDRDAGDYQFDFEVRDTEAADSASITVNDVDADLNFAESSIDVTQGDVAEITVEIGDGTDTGTVLIGDYDDDGYQANISVTDDSDDQVTFYFNTYLAGMNSTELGDSDGWSGDIVSLHEDAESDDEVTLKNEDKDYQNVSDLLETGSYEIAAVNGNAQDAMDSPDNVGTLYIEERSTDAVNTWTISENNEDDLSDLEELSARLDDNTLTEAGTLADGDYLVSEISASGLEGMIEAEGLVDADGDVATDDFEAWLTDADNSSADYYSVSNGVGSVADDNSTVGFSLYVEEADPPTNRDEAVSDFNDTGVEKVIYDKSEDTFYVAASVDTILDGDLADRYSDGDPYNLNFDVKDARLLDYSESDWQDDDDENWESVSAEFNIEDADAEFDTQEIDGDDYVTVGAAEGQTISGETNVAPGSELTVRATGEDDARFVKSDSEVVVQSDGTFSTELDFSDRAVDEEFEAKISQGALGSDGVTADGMIVEAVEEATPTEEPEPTPTEEPEPTPTEEPEPTPTEEPEPTPTEPEPTPTETTSTPGFGISVAMLALIGAALIALRRKD
ncbi:DUF7827 domain-containing protein [Halanaeroarchaeum sulfurireducens]|uniref:S-layer glycoprotein n=1 Tax=Halanaeroarchaeum sulfurireducens TaxID=1604004 RepID=A0A0F7P8A7_9EURY|nr:BGTF surface domain-containing protein [Halanaeroarchaeum sulfurireducens]AKH96967.1 hypothetical protein HLASF_0462 [Halanaeroarchaeum sulfurireducens]ALG81368.1 hypothetical protein HLASA_0460 [Halanaeroarchaeum sulfurireducens]